MSFSAFDYNYFGLKIAPISSLLFPPLWFPFHFFWNSYLIKAFTKLWSLHPRLHSYGIAEVERSDRNRAGGKLGLDRSQRWSGIRVRNGNFWIAFLPGLFPTTWWNDDVLDFMYIDVFGGGSFQEAETVNNWNILCTATITSRLTKRETCMWNCAQTVTLNVQVKCLIFYFVQLCVLVGKDMFPIGRECRRSGKKRRRSEQCFSALPNV